MINYLLMKIGEVYLPIASLHNLVLSPSLKAVLLVLVQKSGKDKISHRYTYFRTGKNVNP